MCEVYVGMSADMLHDGHINVLEAAHAHGEVTVGLLTDEAIAQKKRVPVMSWDSRKRVISSIRGVKEVVPQRTWDYSENIIKLQPKYMFHGDDWLAGPSSKLREKALEALSSYGGELIEVPYTVGAKRAQFSEERSTKGVTPDQRKRSLREMLESRKCLRFIEAHNPISALLAEHTSCIINGVKREFDGFWSSSLTDSTANGKPDIEALEIGARLNNVSSIFECTRKPLIIDGDTGGKPEHFSINVKNMERVGVSAVIIEDKTGLKKNSLFGNEVLQQQECPNIFAEKIKAGLDAKISDDFMVIARIESLILEKGMGDALKRAQIYVDAGVNGIMIHSREKCSSQVFEFASKFKSMFPNIPLVAVPTSYNSTKFSNLAEAGFNIVIYANHMLRAAYPAMQDVAKSILEHDCSEIADQNLMSVKDILELIPGTK